MADKKNKKKNKRKIKIFVAVAVIIVLAVGLFFFDTRVVRLEDISLLFNRQRVSGAGENELKIHFLDVGQGDCIIIEFPDNTNMIIDGGDTKRKTYQRVVSYAKALKIKTFDYMLLTHSDADHAGGLDDVLYYFDVKTIFMPYIEPQFTVSKAYQRFLAAAKAETDDIRISQYGYAIYSADVNVPFIFAFLSPSPPEIEGGEYDILNAALAKDESGCAREKNDVSPIILLEYAGVKIMFTGDINTDTNGVAGEEKVLRDVLNFNMISPSMFGGGNTGYPEYYIDMEVDLLKVAHHGGEASTGASFLAAARPKNAVISVAADNSYGHPRAEVIQRLSVYTQNIYMTKDLGDITATVIPAPGEKASLVIAGARAIGDSAQREYFAIKIDFYIDKPKKL